jgi:hypothetical protein
MSRQPRATVREKNYNFEQFREYTAMYEAARVKDTENSEQFYKHVKYVKNRVDENGKPKDIGNMVVRDFLAKFQLDKIEIPEEFKNVDEAGEFKLPRSS